MRVGTKRAVASGRELYDHGAASEICMKILFFLNEVKISFNTKRRPLDTYRSTRSATDRSAGWWTMISFVPGDTDQSG
jgi:hypothetical protein